jgi:hypothetical protein
MWENFKSMPLFLKVITFHGGIFLIAAITSLFPIGVFELNGSKVAYREWWMSGAGLEFFAVAGSIGIGAICLLTKIANAQKFYFSIYLLVIFITSITTPTYLTSISSLAAFIFSALFLYWYLFHKNTVKVYFNANNL